MHRRRLSALGISIVLGVGCSFGGSLEKQSAGPEEPEEPEALRVESDECPAALLIQLEAESAGLVTEVEPAGEISDAAIAAGVPLEAGQVVHSWNGLTGVDFEIRYPGSVPVGDGTYAHTVEMPGGREGHQQDSSADSVHHLVVVMLDPQGSDRCDLVSISAFPRAGGVPANALREALTSFAAATKITVVR